MVEKPTGSNSQPNENQDEGNASPTYVTVDQLNAAITARFRAFETKQTDSFARLESLLTARQEPADESSKPTKKQEESKLVQAMENKIKALEAKDQKSRDVAMRSKVQEELIAAGVNPKTIKALLSMHVDADKTISYASDDSDEIVYKSADSVYTLKDGLSNWLKTEDAKPFLAPKGAAGSGDKNYTQQVQGTKVGERPTKEQFGNILLSKLTGFGEPE